MAGKKRDAHWSLTTFSSSGIVISFDPNSTPSYVRPQFMRNESKTSRDKGIFGANRWVWISQEALVGKANKQRRLAHCGVACKTIVSCQFSETTKMHRLNKLAGDDKLENIMPCYPSHGTIVRSRSDGNCREDRTRARSLPPSRTLFRTPPQPMPAQPPGRAQILPPVGLPNGGLDGAKPFGQCYVIDAVHLILRRLNFTVSPATHPHLFISLRI